jgi:hypothetical protein
MGCVQTKDYEWRKAEAIAAKGKGDVVIKCCDGDEQQTNQFPPSLEFYYILAYQSLI